MIVSNIIGGLGNQMFQYATGRALSWALGTSFGLDAGDFAGYKLHQGFELERVFNINIPCMSLRERERMLGWRQSKLARRILARPCMEGWRGSELVFEPTLDYWPDIGKVSEDSYLLGYWQSERYFANYADEIRSEFVARQPLSADNAVWIEQMSRPSTVSLHVRRGDYASNPKTLATHGLCSLDYYRVAVKHILDRVVSPQFYIFSDDLPWVRENLIVNAPCHYVSNNKGADSYMDMQLMSHCQHHVIANSSFSWWGAWLDRNSDAIVIAPDAWFSTRQRPRDLFPAHWEIL